MVTVHIHNRNNLCDPFFTLVFRCLAGVEMNPESTPSLEAFLSDVRKIAIEVLDRDGSRIMLSQDYIEAITDAATRLVITELEAIPEADEATWPYIDARLVELTNSLKGGKP